MLTVTDEAELDGLKQAHDVLVVYFTTQVCNVGEAIFPKVYRLLETRGLPLATVDTTALPAISGQHLVFVVPTLLVFVFGRELARFSRHLSMAEVEAAIDRAVELTAGTALDASPFSGADVLPEDAST